ncbi:MAG: leucyl aminopeptidase [Candidatus Micrarchaeia archaeon]|jgi:leucyl aminopeptidase
MKIDVKAADAREHAAEILVVFAYDDLELYHGLSKFALEEGFKGKLFDSRVVKPPAGFKAKRLILAGLGKRADATDYSVFGAAGRAAQIAKELEAKAVTFEVPGTASTKIEHAARALCEGVLYAIYSFEEFKSKDKEEQPKHKLETLEILATSAEDVSPIKKHAEEAQAIIGSVNFARDLANCPANLKRPPEIAERIRKRLTADGVRCRVLGEGEIRKLGMNGIIGVDQGSSSPPRLLTLEYGKKAAGKKTLCLVGKGVTFDSGGISIKPSRGMDEMKMDMCGAAAVAGAISAMARLKLPVHVVGVMPFVENMPSGTAQRPGDIIRAMNGKTIEVLNTDAEGRLILADALAYAEKTFKPDYIVDIATLTGAVQVALGKHASAVLGNDEKLISAVIDAGESVHERCWQLPLWDDYKEMVKGKFADVKNIGSETGDAGTITASAFLSNFVTPEAKWAHLDIAATAYGDISKPFTRLGASGVGVRLFIDLAKRLV